MFVKSNISFSIVCLGNLSITDSVVLKSLTTLVLLSVSPFRTFSAQLVYLGAQMLNVYVFIILYHFDVVTLLSLCNNLLCLLLQF